MDKLILNDGSYDKIDKNELKENNQMAWVQAMNSIYNRAEELVLHELVYGEDA